ncbi:hypothetical protein, partial [Vibrio fluvialis]|uniref:hypothetical protein n=1 Tax=Vibrio fluvialis TaxID=676 RepID=UPI001ED8D988
ASVKNTILYLNTLFFVEIIKIDKNSKKSLNFHRGICVGKTGMYSGAFLYLFKAELFSAVSS